MTGCWLEDPSQRPDFPSMAATLRSILDEGGDIYAREYLPVFDDLSLSGSESQSSLFGEEGGMEGERGETEAGDSGQGEDEGAEEEDEDDGDLEEELVVVDVHMDFVDENLNDITSGDNRKSLSPRHTLTERSNADQNDNIGQEAT